LNVLRKYHYLRSVDIQIINQLYLSGMDLVDEIIPVSDIMVYIKQISFTLNHPVYDCAYLALAKIRNAKFVSFDKKLLSKAQSLNISTLDANDFLFSSM
ncbi:MAG TPA: type II toxin-antitoxin system VapC family toxin, partial [Saprospiraceae bacterium]|nr:type II toxin-antitoxin system VapC family toxin [Saprospiraceae bacterium]